METSSSKILLLVKDVENKPTLYFVGSFTQQEAYKRL